MKMIIGGAKVDSQSGNVIEVLNPATGEFIDTVPNATEDDIIKALEIAQEGKKLWAETPIHERSRLMMNFAQAAAEKRSELATLISREMGKTIRESEAEINSIINLFKGYAEKANHLYGISVPGTAEKGFEDDVIFTVREPLGVIACIIPFNFPVDLFSHKVAPALAGGNAVILKPSSDNPLVCIRLVEMLIECGVPGSVIQVVTGKGAVVGKALAASPLIDAISLTGSTAVGMEIAKYASANLSRVFLELGGNDPFVVFDDADLDLAVAEAVAARTLNAGQTCCAAKRFIVHHAVKNHFATKLIEKLKVLQIGNPLDRETDIGCLINEKAAAEVEEQVKLTLAQGAKCAYGGKRFSKTFFEPTVLVDVTPDMDVAKDLEMFGPIFPIIGFDTLEEAVRIANQTKYGLQGGVITNDIHKAMKVASKLQCGGVIINGTGTYRSLEMPFGGYKKSGLGREGMAYTLEEMTQVKTIIMKKVLQ